MKDFLALMNPTRWAILAGVVAVLLALAGGVAVKIHYAGVETGRTEVQAKWDKAVAEAEGKQAEQSAKATDKYIEEREVVRVVYRDRIKEIKTYVPSPGTSCPADPGFLQRYNAADAGPAGDAPNQ